jgi:DNA-binding ferritin-like protein
MADKIDNKVKVQNLHSVLRAIHWINWTSHWQVKGPWFLQNHEFLATLYTGVESEIDGLAEKMVSKYGEDVVDATQSLSRMSQIVDKFMSEKDIFKRALTMEETLCSAIKMVLQSLEAADELSPGWDNFIQGICDHHEGNVYKLQQMLK